MKGTQKHCYKENTNVYLTSSKCLYEKSEHFSKNELIPSPLGLNYELNENTKELCAV